MSCAYAGPLRDEPLAIELHNTRYATAAGAIDAFEDAGQTRAWLEAVGPRLPVGADSAGSLPAVSGLVELRGAVRSLLRATLDGASLDPTDLALINATAGRAPRSLRAEVSESGAAVRSVDYHGASRADITCAAFARDAIELITGPERLNLRACGAPGCVLMFLKDHPRREWCSSACGNRARQARHYRRSRGGKP